MQTLTTAIQMSALAIALFIGFAAFRSSLFA
jgi:hypothetical protein